METQYITEEGLKKLKKELEERKNVLRPQISKQILEAIGHGDLSENAEYIEAKELQAFNQGRIEELENIIRNAAIIDPKNKGGMVKVGSTVKVESKEYGTQQFTIVGPSESSPAQGFISNESPLGSAFLDKKRGDKVEAHTPKGAVEYKILEVN